MQRKAAFIDRDGVINEERNYVHQVDDFVLLPGVSEGMRMLHEAGYLLIVITNQAGVARGYYGLDAVDTLHQHMRELFRRQGVELNGIYICPHHPQGSDPDFAIECDCRKPAPGMLLQAAMDFNIDLPNSVLIGDKLSDIEAGRRAGLTKLVLVESGHAIPAEARADCKRIAPNLLEAARLLTSTSTF